MKLTNKQIRKIILEELSKVLNENISEEEMLKLATILLSGEQGFRQAALLLEPLGIITNYEFTDDSEAHGLVQYKKFYKHTFKLDPEFAKAIIKSMQDLERAGKGKADIEQVVAGQLSMFEYDFDEGKTKHRYLFWINPSGTAAGVLNSIEYK